ncbi:MAG: Mth938-like domain-containing protein [Stellaceae bacterium]
MSVDVTPLIPAGRQVIESYGPKGFRVSGTLYPGAILVFPDKVENWTAAIVAEANLDSLKPLLDHGGVEILLLGCGKSIARLPEELRQALRRHGIVVDAMDTGAACRTYNVLLAEERRVAAALLPVS